MSASQDFEHRIDRTTFPPIQAHFHWTNQAE
jgi:hypothetical protein